MRSADFLRGDLMGKPERFGADFAAAMDRLLLRNSDNLTGVVMRLAWCEGLTRDEIYGLTWGQVDLERGLSASMTARSRSRGIWRAASRCGGHQRNDVSLTWEQIGFADGVIDLGDRRLEASEELLAVLRAERQRRADGDDAHVILSPRARKPIRADRLSVVMRSFLLRNGVEARVSDIRRCVGAENDNRKITDYCAAHNGISLRECMALLDMTSAEAFRRIDRLVAAQRLKRSGRRYYLSEDVIAPEDYEDAIINHIKRSGSATRLEVKNLLHIGERNAWTVLTKMVKKGVLKKEIRSEEYTLL